MDPNKLVELQVQMQRNNSDIQSYLTGLDSWTEDIKKKEENFKEKSSTEPTDLPPVRNSLVKKKKKKRDKPASEFKAEPKSSKRIDGFDFKAWDNYDVDKAIAEIDNDEGSKQSSEDDDETDEEWEVERRVQQGALYKDQGNIEFKKGNYVEAIEHYTQGISCDPENAILPANRAMALIKQQKFVAAEADCTDSVVLDPTYVKAYSRRATARAGLGNDSDALRDFEKVLVLEPNNKFAQAESKKLKEKLEKLEVKTQPEEVNPEAGIVRAIYKPPEKRSKKPLRRVPIEEIGVDGDQSIREAIAKAEAAQGGTTRKVFAEDSKAFEKFVAPDTANVNQSEMKDIIQATTAPAIQTFSSPADIEPTNRVIETSKPQSAVISPRLPDVPSSSFQFQADWKVLKNNPEMFYRYFKRIDPSQYTKLVGTSLDADILNSILRMLCDFYLQEKTDIYPVLNNLTAVKRFSMTVMFMSAKEKEVLKTLFTALNTSAQKTTDELDQLSKKYGL